MSEFRFDPATYLDLMRTEVPAYERLQRAVAVATAELTVARVLDLGTGTGETLGAVLEVDVGVQRFESARRRVLVPERVYQVALDHDLIRAERQHCQKRALLAPTEWERARVHRYRERSRHREPHAPPDETSWGSAITRVHGSVGGRRRIPVTSPSQLPAAIRSWSARSSPAV